MNEQASNGPQWLTVAEARRRVGGTCGKRVIYRAVERRRLKAARINERGDLRFRPEWIDEWLSTMVAMPKEAA